MISYVDTEMVGKAAEAIVPDQSIGIYHDQMGRVPGEMIVHVGRLRRALLAFEEEFDGDVAHISILPTPDWNPPGGFLAIQGAPNASRLILLAGRDTRDDQYGGVPDVPEISIQDAEGGEQA